MDAKKEGKKESKAGGMRNTRKEKTGKEGRRYLKFMPYAIVIVLAAVILYLVYFLIANYVSTPFSTFKSNYIGSTMVATVLTYGNATQLSYEIPCSEDIIQAVSYARKAAKGFNSSSIGFFILNSSACSYQVGLGYPISVKNSTARACLSAIKNEPAIYLNYSATNSTIITPYKLYIYGNSNYMKTCSITADLG